MDFIKKILTANNSKKFSICLRDVIFSIYYAVGGSVGTALALSLQAQKLPTLAELKAAAIVGLISGSQHIIRKYFTNSNGTLLIKDESNKP